MAQQALHGSLPTNISQLQSSRCKIRIMFTNLSTEIIATNTVDVKLPEISDD